MENNAQKKHILYEDEGGDIFVVTPTGVLPIEVVALRDIPNGKPYWIVDSDLPEFSSLDYNFSGAYELDKNYLGQPHGIALGYEEWAKQQPPGTPGL